MKANIKLPNIDKVFDDIFSEDREKAIALLTTRAVDKKNRYLHWDKLQYLEPPNQFTSEQWWAGTKYARRTMYRQFSLFNKEGNPFQFSLPDCVLKELHWIDQYTSGSIATYEPITNPHIRNTYLVSSLVNEAINSSQLEGASTTRNIAKEMLQQGRSPRDKSEQMIFNNYRAMQFIRKLKADKLTPSMVLQLHKLVTEKTLDDPLSAGNFRIDEDDIRVVDNTQQEVLHTPPQPSELKTRMKQLCDFANNEDSAIFIHPVIKAIILHFMLAYDHPFVDGNGRTARALFYWFMASQGYWLMEFISISEIIKMAPGQYKDAFLYTETDDSDTTYFIIHQLQVIKKAINHLNSYLERKAQEIAKAKKLIEGISRLQGKLNYRQLAILRHALEHPKASYRIIKHQNIHNVTYETARSDLLKLSDTLKLLEKKKAGREFIFISSVDIQKKLDKLKD